MKKADAEKGIRSLCTTWTATLPPGKRDHPLQISMASPLTPREKVLAGAAILGFGLFIGAIVSVLMAPDIKWGDVGSVGAFVVAAIALVIGVTGYLDNRRAQRLEHRAYIEFQIWEIDISDRARPTVDITAKNYGRTPATNIELAFSYECHVFPGDKYTQPFIRQIERFNIIHPSEDFRELKEIPIAGKLVGATKEINAGYATISTKIEARYVDVFGETQFEISECTFSSPIVNGNLHGFEIRT